MQGKNSSDIFEERSFLPVLFGMAVANIGWCCVRGVVM
jgi:hypothetical protein